MSEHNLISNEPSAMALRSATVGVRPRPICRATDEADLRLSEPDAAADKRRWLAGLMVRQRGTLSRFVLFYPHLQAQWYAWPRRVRRQLGRRLTLTIAGAALLLALSRAPARAANIAVADGEVGASDNGLCSLIEAMRNANDTVDGIIHPDCAAGDPLGADTVTLPVGGHFTVTDSIGHFYDSDTGLTLVGSAITIEGNGATIERDAADADKFRLLAVSSTGDLTLNQVTLSNGYAYSRGAYYYFNGAGGAVYNAGTLTISDSTVSDNSAKVNGGGVFNAADGTLAISNSMISGNSAREGAGVFNEGTLTINDSTISSNTAYSYGGGVWNSYDGVATIRNSTLRDNTASVGGAIDSRGMITIEDSDLTGNTAGTGGGMSIAGGNQAATITDSTIRDNAADYRGGGLHNTSNALTISGSTISGNKAETDGGGISNQQGLLTISNSTISDNTANDNGGGIQNRYATLNITHVMVSGNEAGNGGGVYNSATLNMQNSTIVENEAQSNGGGVLNVSGILTISDSTINGNTAAANGGGLANFDSTLNISDSEVSGNAAEQGGGIWSDSGFYGDSTVTLLNVIVSENKGSLRGGGISVAFSTLLITDGVLISNEAPVGGGVDNTAYSEATINHTVLSGNRAVSGGGGVSNSAALDIRNSMIRDNVVSDSDSGSGGGVNNVSSGVLTITYTTLSGNEAENGGGISNTLSSTAAISNSTLNGNQASLGGGVLNSDGTLTISNSTLSGNDAISGGGINNLNGMATLSNSTISGNTADIGGGLINFGATTFNRSLVSGNTAVHESHEVFSGNAITADNYNLFGHSGIDNATAFLGFTPGANDITATSDGSAPTALGDILDTMLGNNDGRSSGSETRTHALILGSPAIDAAPSADCTVGTPAGSVDQRGKPRNVNGDGRASEKECDIGAFEWQAADAAARLQFLPFFIR